ncbi:haloacid dehalogenase superfamily, subfamily IA, variant 3 with third motif having DD or ED [Agrococcus baldri]|uniref:Haloacid dehalogenase superfamily, subfamily IA, variant 3 with third motif having DD or ED n=1 Tax=Agrococcus baldri TaxID=153730 RepID=A0AA94HKE6_9MICO|nr:haloacid dehalogenase superfamily, subfamily IA, variant 3 with third motif having DD or ED [Agrococcus baldri]
MKRVAAPNPSVTPASRGGHPLYEAIVFDCDGVLVDSEELAMEVSHRLLAELGLHYDPAEMRQRFVGCSSQFFRETVEADLGRPLPPDWDTRSSNEMAEALRRDVTAIPGVEAALRSVRLPIAVASNSGHDRIRLSLETVGLIDMFDSAIASAEDVAEGKPAPDVYLHAAALLGADPARCIAIDDSHFGVLAAYRAGMRVLAFEGAGPIAKLPDSDRVTRFQYMRELPALLDTVQREVLVGISSCDGNGKAQTRRT